MVSWSLLLRKNEPCAFMLDQVNSLKKVDAAFHWSPILQNTQPDCCSHKFCADRWTSSDPLKLHNRIWCGSAVNQIYVLKGLVTLPKVHSSLGVTVKCCNILLLHKLLNEKFHFAQLHPPTCWTWPQNWVSAIAKVVWIIWKYLRSSDVFGRWKFRGVSKKKYSLLVGPGY